MAKKDDIDILADLEEKLGKIEQAENDLDSKKWKIRSPTHIRLRWK